MKVLFVSQFIAKPNQPGQNRIFDLLQALASHGHEVHVVTCGVHYLKGTLAPELDGRKFAETRWGDVRVTLTYASPGFRAGTVARLRSYFSFVWYAFRAALRVASPDLLIVSIQPMFIAPFAWCIARVRGIPLLVEVRDIWPDVAVEMGALKNRTVIRLGRWLEHCVYRCADRLVVIGPEMKRLITAKGIPESKIDVIPQGFQPSPIPATDRQEVRERLRVEGRFVVMFTGSFGVANNDLPLVIDAAARLRSHPDICFLLVGEGDRRAEYEARCREEGLTNVQFLPLVPKNEVPSLLAAADVCIMTLPRGDFWKICLQNKIFDYLGNGKPVVAAVAGDQADLIKASAGGVVVAPGDLEGFCQAIIALRDDGERRRRLGESARAYTHKHLLRDDFLRGYVRLVESMVSAP